MTLPATFTVANAIDEGFERCGFDPAKIGAQHIVSARRSIRLLLADWNTDGVLFWKVAAAQTHTVAVGESSFTAVAGTIDVLDMACRRNSLDTPMVTLSRSDWFAIPDKGIVSSMATRYWVERVTAGATVHFYPKADNATDILVYDAMLYFDDSGTLANAADIPDRWLEAFVAGLTCKLAEKFARPLLAEKAALYGGPGTMKGAYARARTGDRERSDTIFTIQRHRRSRR